MDKLKQFFSAPVFATRHCLLRASLLISSSTCICHRRRCSYCIFESVLEEVIFSLAALAMCIPALGMRVLLHRGRFLWRRRCSSGLLP